MNRHRIFVTCLVVAFVVAFIVPTASAREFGNVEKGIGRVICTPLKTIGQAFSNIFERPTGILAIPKTVRRGAFDTVESTGRMLVAAEPVAIEDMGSLNTTIADAGADWVVDAVFYAAIVGPSVHNSHEIGHGHHYLLPWKAAGWTALGVGAADIIDKAGGGE